MCLCVREKEKEKERKKEREKGKEKGRDREQGSGTQATPRHHTWLPMQEVECQGCELGAVWALKCQEWNQA